MNARTRDRSLHSFSRLPLAAAVVSALCAISHVFAAEALMPAPGTQILFNGPGASQVLPPGAVIAGPGPACGFNHYHGPLPPLGGPLAGGCGWGTVSSFMGGSLINLNTPTGSLLDQTVIKSNYALYADQLGVGGRPVSPFSDQYAYFFYLSDPNVSVAREFPIPIADFPLMLGGDVPPTDLSLQKSLPDTVKPGFFDVDSINPTTPEPDLGLPASAEIALAFTFPPTKAGGPSTFRRFVFVQDAGMDAGGLPLGGLMIVEPGYVRIPEIIMPSSVVVSVGIVPMAFDVSKSKPSFFDPASKPPPPPAPPSQEEIGARLQREAAADTYERLISPDPAIQKSGRERLDFASPEVKARVAQLFAQRATALATAAADAANSLPR